MYKDERILQKGDRFVAINRKTRQKAISGGICTVTKVVLSDAGTMSHVEAKDAAHADLRKANRVFRNHIWRFSMR